MSESLIVAQEDGVAHLTLNRPDQINALSKDLLERLRDELTALAGRTDVRVIVLSGAGTRGFSAGADLKERRGMSAQEKWEQSKPLREACAALWNAPQPALAAIHGWCLGGGFELALSCDLRIADDTAVFAWPEMQLGAYPGGTAAVTLPRLVGRSIAKDLFFSARRVSAAEAQRLGIVDRLVEAGRAPLAAREFAEVIKVNTSPLGAAGVKRMVNHATHLSLEEALAMNEQIRAPLEGTDDYQEGIAAFFEKRKPVWRGR